VSRSSNSRPLNGIPNVRKYPGLTIRQSAEDLVPSAAAGLPSTWIWVAVFPTLTALNLLLGDRLADLPSVLRTFVLATVAVPIVIYGVMPRLHRLRARIIARVIGRRTA